MTASSFRELFLRVQGRRLVASPCLHQRQVAKAAVSLGPEAQDRHAFCPDSFLRVEPFPLP